MNEVEEIKQRLDVVEVVGGYVVLKPAGRNFKGLSPFKQEKTPSLMVSPEKGIWHDFSSGQGGDIFTFVQMMEGVDFREALEILARRAGVELKSRHSNTSGNKSRLYEAVELATGYYHATLAKNPKALKYLTNERSLNKATIKAFKLGYAPDSWEALSGFLLQKGFKASELVSAGLVGQKPGNKSVYDLFRGRVLFPIFDVQGRAIGFSGRVLDGDSKGAKYINTPQTLIYNKSTAIFGLLQAKESIRQLDKAIIVEGNMDVVALANASVTNAIATSGTSLTEAQLKILARITKNIKLAFDSDEAGVNATIRAIELAAGLDLRLSVINYQKTGAKDPDELVRRNKPAWEQAVKNAQYAIDFLFDLAEQRFNLSSAPGKKQASDFLIPVIKLLSDDVERDHYIKKLSKRLVVNEASIRSKLAKSSTSIIPTAKISSEVVTVPSPAKLSRATVLENQLLELLLAFPYTREALADLVLDDISEANRPLYSILQKKPKAKLDAIASALQEKANDVKILALRGEEEYSSIDEHDIRLEAYTQVHRLQKYNRELNKRRLARQIAEAEAAGNKAEAVELLSQYQLLIREE